MKDAHIPKSSSILSFDALGSLDLASVYNSMN